MKNNDLQNTAQKNYSLNNTNPNKNRVCSGRVDSSWYTSDTHHGKIKICSDTKVQIETLVN